MVYRPPAVNFDGNSLLKIANLAATDNQYFGWSSWIKVAMANWTPAGTFWASDPEGAFADDLFPVNPMTMEQQFGDATDTQQLNLTGTNNCIPNSTWCNIIGAGDTQNGFAKLLVNNVDVSGIKTFGMPFNMVYNGKTFYFMGDSLGDQIQACVSDTSFWPGVNFFNMAGDIDPAIAAVFINPMTLYPVDPSAAIALLGTPAILYSGNAASYATNLGSGGASALIGDALTDCATAPGPPPVVPQFNYGGSSRVNVRNIKSSAFERMSVQARGMELANLTRV